jgi:hypothetical protein
MGGSYMKKYLSILILSLMFGLYNQPTLYSMNDGEKPSGLVSRAFSFFGSVVGAGKTTYYVTEAALQMGALFYHIIKGGCKFAIDDIKILNNACKNIKMVENDPNKSPWEKICSISWQLSKIGIWLPTNLILAVFATKCSNFLSIGKIILLLATTVILKREFSTYTDGSLADYEFVTKKLEGFYKNYVLQDCDATNDAHAV